MKFIRELHNVASYVNVTCIISLDGWYRFILDKVKGMDFKILHELIPAVKFLKKDEFGDVVDNVYPIDYIDKPLDYDFYTDETIQMDKLINPIDIIPQEGLRYSIINILAYCIGNVINDYMINYTKQSNSYSDDRKCLLIMKNEFLFKSIFLADKKKNYASIQELQEGNIVPENKQLDIKGLMMSKSNLNQRTQDRLQEIMYEDVLMTKDIDEVNILKQLAIFEKEIWNSLQNGEKNFYKPVNIKALNKYDDPMRIQGIKASIVWNTLKEEGVEAIDLEARNSIDLVKVNITPKTIECLRIDNPEMFQAINNLMTQKEFSSGIDCVAIPKNVNVPKWVINFIDYKTIINDNVKHFPIEMLNIYRGNANNNYTNILKL